MCWDKILVEGKIVRKWMLIGFSISFGFSIYLIFLMAVSFQNYVFSPDIDDLISNWRKEPIKSIKKVPQCSEYLSEYQWSGLRSGCDCTDSINNEEKRITFFQCSTEQLINNCINVENIDEIKLNTWLSTQEDNTLFIPCIERLKDENFINSYGKKNNDCGQQKQKCGFNGEQENSYSMCLTQCPIINIFEKEKQNLPQNKNKIVGQIESTFYYSISSEKDIDYPIVELTTQIPPSVCLYKKGRKDIASTNSNAQYNSEWQFTLLKSYQEENCEEEDKRYFPIITMPINQKNFISLNGIKQVSTYPGYPVKSKLTLYGRRIIQFSEKCRNSGMVEDILDFHNMIQYNRMLRLSATICQTFMIFLLLTIFISTICEIGWRNKSKYYCKYQSPDCLAYFCRKKRLENNEESITDYWRLYDPCYVIWVSLYIILQIACFVICMMYSVKSSIFANGLKSISKSNCSDNQTNSMLNTLSSDYSDDVWSKDTIILIVYPLFFAIQGIAFIIVLRIVTNHRREWFITKLQKKQVNILKDGDPILTSEETEEENFKKYLAQQKIIEKQRQQQNQIIQADFIQRTNLINQSLSYFQTQRINLTNGQSYQYELSRISQLQQNNSLNNSFNILNQLNNNNNKFNTSIIGNITQQNSLNNTMIQDQNAQTYLTNLNDSKVLKPPILNHKSNSNIGLSNKPQSIYFNRQISTPIRSQNNALKENFLIPSEGI